MSAKPAFHFRLVASNFLSLSLIQGVNFLLPLLTIPIAVRVIGDDRFGVVNYAMALIAYFQIICDYGFNLTATRQVSMHRDNPEKVSRIYSLTMASKLLLMLVSFSALLVVILIFPALHADWYIYVLTFLVVIGQVLIPVWFYQGLEIVPIMAVFNMAARALYVIGIYLFLRSREQDFFLPLFNGLSMILAGLLGSWYAIRKYKIHWYKPSFHEIKANLKDSWSVFITGFAINANMNSNILILGIFASDAVVGWYAVVEKIILLLRHTSALVFQVVYPRLCMLVTESHITAVTFLRKIMRLSGAAFLLSGLVMMFAAPLLVKIMSGTENPVMIDLVRVMALVPFITNLNLPALQFLLVHEFKKSYTHVLFYGLGVSIGLNTLLSPWFGAHGTSFSVLITELFITASLHFVLHYRHKEFRYFISLK